MLLREIYWLRFRPLPEFAAIVLTVELLAFYLWTSPVRLIFKYDGSQSESTELDIFDPTVKLSQDHPQILNYIRKHHLYPPPLSVKERRLVNTVKSTFKSYTGELSPLLLGKGPGFFIECGANDGEFLSNVIGLEVLENWTGLLIEASPVLFKKMVDKKRNAWLSNVCLSGPHPEKIDFLKHKAKYPYWRVGNGKIDPNGKYQKPGHKNGYKEEFRRQDYESEGLVDCVPLYSILAAMNVTHVDFFSLDVEGHEYKILEAIPFNQIRIEVILVEHWLAPEGKDAIKDLVLSKGYSLVLQSESDYIFKRND